MNKKKITRKNYTNTRKNYTNTRKNYTNKDETNSNKSGMNESVKQNNVNKNKNTWEVSEEEKKGVKKLMNIRTGPWNEVVSFNFDALPSNSINPLDMGKGKQVALYEIQDWMKKMKTLERKENELIYNYQKETNEYNIKSKKNKNKDAAFENADRQFKMNMKVREELKKLSEAKKTLYNDITSLPGIVPVFDSTIPNNETALGWENQFKTNDSNNSQQIKIKFGVSILLAGAAVTTALLLDG